MRLRMAGEEEQTHEESPLRTCFSPPWACMSNCGACCYLAPEERDLTGLTEEETELYMSMVEPDGWCKNYDKETKLCKIYEDRPSFCRVERFSTLYGYEEDDLGDAAADSCREHIAQVYGELSPEMDSFDVLQDHVREAAGWVMIADDGEEEPDMDLSTLPIGERIPYLEAARASLVEAKARETDPSSRKEMEEALGTLSAVIKDLQAQSKDQST